MGFALNTRRRYWTYKPPPGTRLNPAHSLASGLLHAFPFNDGSGTNLVDLVTTRSAVLSASGPTWTAGDMGPAIAIGGSTSNYSITGTGIPYSYPLTLVAISRATAGNNSTFRQAFALLNSGNTQFIAIGWAGTTGIPAIGINAGSLVSANGSALGVGGSSSIIHGVFASATDRRLYVNGVLAASSSTSTALPTLANFRLGLTAGVFADYALGLIYGRELGVSEIAEQAADPWGLFLPPTTRRLVFFSASATASGTFAATLGTVTLSATGTAAAPAGSSGTLTAPLGAVTFAGSGSVTAPNSTFGAFGVTVADAAFSGTASSASPGAAAGTFGVTLGAETFAGAASAASPGAAGGTFGVTLSDATFAGTASASAPSGSAGTFASSLGAVAFAGSAGSTAPGVVGAALAVTLGDVTFAGSGSATAPAGSSAAFSATLDAIALSASGTVSIPGSVSGTFAATLGGVTLIATAPVVNPPPAAKNLVAAMIARAMSAPAIAAMLPGGITFGRADRDVPEPYGSIFTTSASDMHCTGPGYVREASYQLSLFMAGADDLDTIADLIKRAFNIRMAPLSFGDGTHVMALAGPLMYVGEDEGIDGRPLHHGYVPIRTYHNRSLA